MNPTPDNPTIHSFITQLEVIVYLLSMTVTGLFAFVIFSLRRNTRILQDKKWTSEFAWTFLVLAAGYFFQIILSIVEGHGYAERGQIFVYLVYLIKILKSICSGVTNYLLFLVALRLMDNKIFPKLRGKPWLSQLKHQLLDGPDRMPLLLLLPLLILAVIQAIGSSWARTPDSIISALILAFFGYVLYRIFVARTDKLVAWIAFFSTSVYAIISLCYGLSTYFVKETSDQVDLAVYIVSLFLKTGLFLSGYSLMLLISGPIQGVERLLHSVIRQQKDYLESDGILKSISEELQASRVNLYIKIPNKDKIARYTYPVLNQSDDQKPEILDYVKGTNYDQVLTRHDDNSEVSGEVPKLNDAAVPVLFHDRVIACLEAKISDDNFTEGDKVKLQRIAVLISPVVQAFREVSAMNEISQDNSLLRIDVVSYNLQQHIDDMATIMQNVMSPLAAGISVKAGFLKYVGVSKQDQVYQELMKRHLKSSFDEVNHGNKGRKNFLSQELKILYQDQSSDGLGGTRQREQELGRFVMALEIEGKKKIYLTLSTGLFYGQAVSNLLTDNLLNFVRGYLNEKTDELGKRLGGLTQMGTRKWYEEVDRTAKEAGLLWVVATQSDSDNLLGEDETVDLVTKLELTENWQQRMVKGDEFWTCKLDAPEMETHHVIKRRLAGAEQTLWFGVKNSDFGPEMDYTSPWRFFLVQFCDMADSALQRIIDRQREAEHKKHLAELQSTARLAMQTGIVIHELVNQVRGWTFSVPVLEEAVRNGSLICNDSIKDLILKLPDSVKRINEQVKWYAGVGKPDDLQPCSLAAVIKDVQKACEDSLDRYGIKLEHPFSSESNKETHANINLSHYVATDVLVNIVRNAKDAIRDGGVKDGVIQINIEETDGMVICHVTDNGPGIPKHARKTLLKSVTKTNKPLSHGLGLYLSARWLELNNGNIFIKHYGPDPETTFSVYFPKAKNI